MRDKFIGYFPLNDEELHELFNDSLVVLDTNSLLNLYRYKQDVREQFMKMLTRFSTRLWLPHRVAFEFHRRRVNVIREQQEAVAKISKLLDDAAASLSGGLATFARNPIVAVEPIARDICSRISDMRNSIDNLDTSAKDKFGVTPQNDGTLLKIAELYAGRVGEEFSEEEMEDLRKEGEVRYKARVPPGYRDEAKDGDEKYGDLIIWKQVIAYAQRAESSVLFLTDDNKEDWWWKSNGETLGPRAELREEFRRLTGKIFYCYRPHYFLEILQKRGDLEISNDVVREVEETSQISNERDADQSKRELARRASIARQIVSDLDSVEYAAPDISDKEKMAMLEGHLRALEDLATGLATRMRSSTPSRR